MSTLVRATDLIGLPVVTLAGDDVAEVRDVVFEPSRGTLLGFTLNKRGYFSGRLKQVLTIESVIAVGPDAAIVADEDALAAKSDTSDAPASMREASMERNVIGVSIITDEGSTLGEVTDVVVSLGKKPEVVGYELSGDLVASTRGGRHLFIPLPEQLAISGDALMVPTAFDHFVRDDLTGFAGAVAEYRASHARKSTKPKKSPTGAPPDSLTRAQLYEQARTRNVPGRSSMTKAELISALASKRGSA